jgi:RNA polymerase sigma-70 factor (ECF subfamily)
MAFSDVVDRHERALLSFAAAFLRDEAAAQDVVQEAFLRAARDPQRLLSLDDPPGSGGTGGPGGSGVRNWLLKVVRDLSVDSLRRKASERRALNGLAAVSARSTPGPDAVLEAREEHAHRTDRARAAIDALRPRLREVLLLKVREKKSYKEIAEICGLTVTNVGFLLHQAMQELKQIGARDEGLRRTAPPLPLPPPPGRGPRRSG